VVAEALVLDIVENVQGVELTLNICQCCAVSRARRDYKTSCRETTLHLDDTACMTAPWNLPATQGRLKVTARAACSRHELLRLGRFVTGVEWG
jgi:hypothetical protein